MASREAIRMMGLELDPDIVGPYWDMPALRRLWEEAWPGDSAARSLAVNGLMRGGVTPEDARRMSDREVMSRGRNVGKKSVALMRAALGRQHCVTCTCGRE